jgi:membrane protein implicated in regulation of membrane protease activity
MNGPFRLGHKRATGKNPTPWLAYATVNTAVWIMYAALVVLAPIVLPSSNPVVVTAVVLVAAVVFHPLRRDVHRAAKRRFSHRRAGLEKQARLTTAIESDHYGGHKRRPRR